VITYAAINLTNKKFYVGSTANFEARCKKHLQNKGDLAFHRSLRKDPENFYWIVSEDDGLSTREEEQYYLDFYHGSMRCYNLRPSAESGGDTCSATTWWNNGEVDRRSEKCPGEGWVPGRLNISEAFTAIWWNDGVNSVRSAISPGEGWVRGHLNGVPKQGHQLGQGWWNNGIQQKRSFDCPGEGWTKGMLRRGK
jgi:hypothetical protein